MVKAVKHSTVARELKREYLKEHLEDVKKLISSWIPQLIAPEPLNPKQGTGGWQSSYRPVAEQDPDNNHILRRHLKSRALWSHHANWERKLDKIWHSLEVLRDEANSKYGVIGSNTRRQYTPEYVTVGLWKGFDLAYNGELKDWYKVPDDQQGVSYGAYKIEVSAKSPTVRSLVIKEHMDFIHYVAGLEDMKALVEIWRDTILIQKQMQSISSKSLKSVDILYPCTFCKHLWK